MPCHRRLAQKAKVVGRAALRELACIVTPDTLLRWHRELIAKKYDGSQQRRPGRPGSSQEIRALIVRMAEDNHTWGYTRIRGALRNLGHRIGRNTMKRILKDHGLEPAPERGRGMRWDTFLKAHWGGDRRRRLLLTGDHHQGWLGSLLRTFCDRPQDPARRGRRYHSATLRRVDETDCPQSDSVVDQILGFLEEPIDDIDNQLIESLPKAPMTQGPVLRRERLGGMLSYYYREAA